MQARIRHIAHRRKGIVTESEKLLDKQSITIGRATDQDIFLADSGVSTPVEMPWARHVDLPVFPELPADAPERVAACIREALSEA